MAALLSSTSSSAASLADVEGDVGEERGEVLSSTDGYLENSWNWGKVNAGDGLLLILKGIMRGGRMIPLLFFRG